MSDAAEQSKALALRNMTRACGLVGITVSATLTGTALLVGSATLIAQEISSFLEEKRKSNIQRILESLQRRMDSREESDRFEERLEARDEQEIDLAKEVFARLIDDDDALKADFFAEILLWVAQDKRDIFIARQLVEAARGLATFELECFVGWASGRRGDLSSHLVTDNRTSETRLRKRLEHFGLIDSTSVLRKESATFLGRLVIQMGAKSLPFNGHA